MKPLISIIIPVFNTANYLDQCINSLLQQTYTNCEFIFINDGSTDNSLYILEKHKAKDSRIHIVSQENKGVSIARNNGLKIAKGSYIGFVDSDDWIEKDMYSILFEAIQLYSCDVVLSNMVTFLKDNKVVLNYSFPINEKLNNDFIKDTILPYLIENDDLYSSCNKLFITSIIKENNIQFPSKNKLSEDNVFNLLYFNKIKSMVYLDYSGYNYRELEGSATRNVVLHDYFQNVLRLYHFDYMSILDLRISQEKIVRFKSLKLIKNVLSLLHIYFNPSNKLSFKERYAFVKAMISNAEVQKEIHQHFHFLVNNSNRYNSFLIKSIKNKSTLKLHLATMYSRYRNN
jgi:glycosyltransferase involved in cell wall biosynthesis